MTSEKYASEADRWTERAYADAEHYLARRAAAVLSLGPPLGAGEVVLDLACGDGGLGAHLLAGGVRYVGVDLSPEMVSAARRRLGAAARVDHADLNEYVPREPVAATTCFRAIYYVRNRLEFLRRVGEYTERKFVFDLNPRQYGLEEVRRDLARTGFSRLELRPFFVPQTHALPRGVRRALEAAERVPPLARALLRFRFTYVCAASRN